MKKILIIITMAIALLSGCSNNETTAETASITVKSTQPTIGEFSLYGNYIAELEPQNQTAIMPMIAGEVEEVMVNIGDTVTEGDVLFTIDTENANDLYDSASDALSRANENYSNIYDSTLVKAPISGYIRSIDTEVLATVSPTSQLAYIANESELDLRIPFLSQDAEHIMLGDTAQVTLIDTGEALTGTVSEISGSPEFLFGNIMVNYITINVINPGGVQAGREATATIGAYTCSNSAFFDNQSSAAVSSGLAGTVEEVLVQNGDFVEVGQPLFRVENASLSGQLTNASNSINDAADSRDDAAELLDEHRVTAPISGIVSTISIEPLDILNSNSVAMEIVSEDGNFVSFAVSEKTIPYLTIGQPLTVMVNDQELSGQISEIGQVASPQTGMFTVKGQIDNGGSNLYYGTMATISLANFTAENALTIPFDAVQYQGDEAYVYVNNNGIAEKRIISLGQFNQDQIIVLDGLSADDRVIITWSDSLRNNAKVVEENQDVSN